MTKDSKDMNYTFSLTDEIADIVRQRILKGEYEIGEKIKESKIASEFSVSRTPIREAFKLLENEGLIDYIPNRGCFAKGFTREDIGDIYAVREALEELSVIWAVHRIKDEEVKMLEDQCDLMEFYSLKKDIGKVLELNSGFHDIIYSSSRSRFLAQVLRSYKEYLDKTRRTDFYNEDFLDDIISEHKMIVKAIRARDEDEAKKAVAVHMENSRKRAELVWNIK